MVTPTGVEKPDPNMQSIQLILYSDGVATGGVSVPIDLFQSFAYTMEQLQTLAQSISDLEQNLQGQLNDVEGRVTVLEGEEIGPT